MNLKMNASLGEDYHSGPQKIRVITEKWVKSNMFCPYCGNDKIKNFENNKPVADFYCNYCAEEYELKSKNGAIKKKVVDGAYSAMVGRIKAINNPNFFFMQYEKANMQVKDFLIVPKYFFTKDIIEKRKPLSDNARRAGWVGCNILLSNIPNEGKIFIVKNGKEQEVDTVVSNVKRTNFIKCYKLDGRGWIIDVLNCVNKIENTTFTLKDLYGYEEMLAKKHPDNHHVKDKIRQQLQVLRDKGIIEFNGKGQYRKV